MNKKNGFTLVELSIVLVIIGLLIGGILVGQSMISTANIQSFIRQIQQYDVAVANFKTAYRQSPGDSNLFTPAGNNNGGTATAGVSDVVAGGVAVCGIATCLEQYSFWKHLSDSGMIKDTYTVDYSAGIASGINVPKTALNRTLVGGRWSAENGSTRPQGYTYATGSTVADQMSGVNAMAVDSKMDDGGSITGLIRGYNPVDASQCDMTKAKCVLILVMGLTSGQPQTN